MLRRFSFIIAILGFVAYGCSLIEEPISGGHGTVSFRLVRSDAQNYEAEGLRELAMALPTTDSIQVDVYPPTGGVPEIGTGFAVALGQDTVEVALSVIAGQGKRVAVRLFGANSLLYWGVDPDVDVAPDLNTHVSIQTSTFNMGALWFNPVRVWDNEAFTMIWNSVAGATSYHVQESQLSDFSTIGWEDVVSDTFIPGPVPAGDYYFRVRAINDYVDSDWRFTTLHVGGVPSVSGISSSEVIRGETVDFDVFGLDLDHPSTTITVFGRTATILNATPTQLTARVQAPTDALSDVVIVANTFGSDASPSLLKVQTIAYVMGTLTGGDWASTNYYKALIESYGDAIDQGAVAPIPYDIAGLISDWDAFDVIIIGADTGTDAASWAGGGAAAAVLASKIEASNAAMLGIGRGGASYFERVALDIGLQNCQTSFQATGVVTDASAEIYTKPIDLGLSNGQTITLYDNTVLPRLLSANLTPSPPPPRVSFYAQRSILESLFPLVEQIAAGSNPSLCLLWGFEAPPSTLTLTGFALFENTINYLYGQGAKTGNP